MARVSLTAVRNSVFLPASPSMLTDASLSLIKQTIVFVK